MTAVMVDISQEDLHSSMGFVSSATTQATNPATALSPGVLHHQLQIIMHRQAAMDSSTMLSPPSTNSRHMLKQGIPGLLLQRRPHSRLADDQPGLPSPSGSLLHHKHSMVQQAT